MVDPLPPYDGSLDIDSNYTGFVEILGEFSWRYSVEQGGVTSYFQYEVLVIVRWQLTAAIL